MKKHTKSKKQKLKEIIIGTGARRIVYHLGEYRVLKVPKSKYGVKSNHKEVVIYKASPYRLKRHLGKIYMHAHGDRWIVMKKYVRLFPKSSSFKRKLHKLKFTFRKYGILPYEVTDRRGNPNYQNLRIDDNGKIIVIDYGNFVKYRRRRRR